MLLSATLIVVVDQTSKAWTRTNLVEHGIALWPGHLYLELVHNRGATLGWLAEQPGLATLLTFGTMSALAAWWAIVAPRRWTSGLGLGLVLGGAGSNLFDRLARPGAVVDMIVVIFAPGRRFPAFNVADAAVTVGLLALGVAILRSRPDPSADST